MSITSVKDLSMTASLVSRFTIDWTISDHLASERLMGATGEFLRAFWAEEYVDSNGYLHTGKDGLIHLRIDEDAEETMWQDSLHHRLWLTTRDGSLGISCTDGIIVDLSPAYSTNTGSCYFTGQKGVAFGRFMGQGYLPQNFNLNHEQQATIARIVYHMEPDAHQSKLFDLIRIFNALISPSHKRIFVSTNPDAMPDDKFMNQNQP